MKQWTNSDYELWFQLASSGYRFYESDFQSEEEKAVKNLILRVSGSHLTDTVRVRLLEIALDNDCGYKRPIRDWQAGVRIYAGFFNRSFFGQYYLGLKPYAHQDRWRKNYGLRRHLQLAPRSHGKSRIYSFELPVRKICLQDNIRLLHITNVGNEAQKYLLAIRRQFESNDRIIYDFGNLTKGLDEQGLEVDLSGTWSKDMFYVRRSNNSLKDPTLQAIGTGQAITGARFDGIIADDIIEKNDSDTQQKRDDIESWFNATILELLDEKGWALMIGTRKNSDDLYERTQNKPTWTYGIDKAIIKYPTHYEFVMKEDENGIPKLVEVKHSDDGVVLASDMWPIEKMLEKKLENATTPWVFDREQQQEITEEKNKVFQMAWMDNDFEFTPDGNIKRFSDGAIVDFDDLVIVDGTDLASSKSNKADYFVDFTIGVDYNFNIYCLDFVRNKYTFGEQTRAIVATHRKWGSQLVGIEAVAYQAAMEQHLIETTEVPAVQVSRGSDKITRGFAVQPYFQNRKVFFLKGRMALVKGELNDFPDGAHDDIFDALETAIQLAVERVRAVKDLREKKMSAQITVNQFRDLRAREERIGYF
ncbi:MAG: phage terminase large subunit [bacterium]